MTNVNVSPTLGNRVVDKMLKVRFEGDLERSNDKVTGAKKRKSHVGPLDPLISINIDVA